MRCSIPGVGLADGALALLLGDAFLRVVDGLGRRFLTERDDVARFVVDVRHVDVDQAQTDFFQLGLDVPADLLEELIAVGVDLLDVHRCDDDTKLTEDDVLGKLLNLAQLQSQQALWPRSA